MSRPLTSLPTTHEISIHETKVHENSHEPSEEISHHEKTSPEVPDWRRKSTRIPNQTESHTHSRKGERTYRRES